MVGWLFVHVRASVSISVFFHLYLCVFLIDVCLNKFDEMLAISLFLYLKVIVSAPRPKHKSRFPQTKLYPTIYHCRSCDTTWFEETETFV